MPLFDKPEDRYQPEDKANVVAATSKNKAVADKLGKSFNDKIGNEPDDEVDETVSFSSLATSGLSGEASKKSRSEPSGIGQMGATPNLKSSNLGNDPLTEVALDDTGVYDDLTKSGIMAKNPPTDKSTYVGAFAENIEVVAQGWMEKITPVDPHLFKQLASSGLGVGASKPLTSTNLDTGDNFATLRPTTAKVPAPSGESGQIKGRPHSVASFNKTAPLGSVMAGDQTDHFCKAISVTLQPMNEGVERSIRQGITPVMGSRRWSIPYQEIPYAEPLKELAYDKNTGAMEINSFYEKATPAQIAKFELFVKDGSNKQAWMMVQAVTGIKLMGDAEFGTAEELAFFRHEQGL